MRSTNRKLVVDSLEAKQMLSANVPEVEPNDTQATAVVFTLDASDHAADLNGSISSITDQDFFQTTVAEGGKIQLNASSPNGLSVKVSVEDDAGNKLFETEPKNGILSGEFNVTAGEKLHLRVEGRKDMGSYSIHLSQTPTPGGPGGGGDTGEPSNIFNEQEPNNTEATANKLNLGSDNILQFRGVSDNTLDDDYFEFTASKDGTLHIDMNNDPLSATPGIQIEVEIEGRGKILEMQTQYYGPTSGTVHVNAGEKVFLRMRAATNQATPYAIDLVFADPADLNADGIVDALDAARMFEDFGHAGSSDLNGDGIVDAADAGILFASWTG